MKLKFLARLLAGAALVSAGVANANEVTFEGVAFNHGSSATYVHTIHSDDTFGPSIWKLNGDTPFSYQWTETGGLGGAQAVFGDPDHAPLELTLDARGVDSRDVGVKLLIGTGAGGPGINTLNVSALPVGGGSSNVNTPAGDVDLTHVISGSLNYEFTTLSGAFLGDGVFTFDSMTMGGLFNRVGRIDGSAFDIAAFIWGDGGMYGNRTDCADFATGSNDKKGCKTLKRHFGDKKVGMDLAFTGSLTASEPGTLGLLGAGMLLLTGRRLRKRAA